jgi:hypothetical protein
MLDTKAVQLGFDQLIHRQGAIGQLLCMQRSHRSHITPAWLESTLRVGWSASRGCSYVGTPAAINRAGWREAEPNRSEARFQVLVCLFRFFARGMTSTGAIRLRRKWRGRSLWPWTTPHIRSARGCGWLKTSNDQDEIILLHGVTTKVQAPVRSHRRCTDSQPQQAGNSPTRAMA